MCIRDSTYAHTCTHTSKKCSVTLWLTLILLLKVTFLKTGFRQCSAWPILFTDCILSTIKWPERKQVTGQKIKTELIALPLVSDMPSKVSIMICITTLSQSSDIYLAQIQNKVLNASYVKNNHTDNTIITQAQKILIHAHKNIYNSKVTTLIQPSSYIYIRN